MDRTQLKDLFKLPVSGTGIPVTDVAVAGSMAPPIVVPSPSDGWSPTLSELGGHQGSAPAAASTGRACAAAVSGTPSEPAPLKGKGKGKGAGRAVPTTPLQKGQALAKSLHKLICQCQSVNTRTVLAFGLLPGPGGPWAFLDGPPTRWFH